MEDELRHLQAVAKLHSRLELMVAIWSDMKPLLGKYLPQLMGNGSNGETLEEELDTFVAAAEDAIRDARHDAEHAYD